MAGEVQRLTVNQLLILLGQIRGCRIATIEAETIPILRQKVSQSDPTPCPWFNQESSTRDPKSRRWFLRKTATFSVPLIGQAQHHQPSPYETAVNRRYAARWQPIGPDGTLTYFQSRKPIWGKRQHTAPLKVHEGKYYLDIQRLRVLSCFYRDIRDDSDIYSSEIEPWLIGRQTESDRQELPEEDKVVWRSYGIQNIRRVHANSYEYEIARVPRMKATRENSSERLKRRRKPKPKRKPKSRRRNVA